ncbi:MAG: hypothetical protein ACLVL7_09140 [Anaerotruncus massiliensis (ex Togo et al. 2019)]
MLAVVLATITGANYPPSCWRTPSSVQDRPTEFFVDGRTLWVNSLLVAGLQGACMGRFRVAPMAIFFPPTLLEDSGYLPRIAFNLDRGFKRCHACGKQALTMCMFLMQRGGDHRPPHIDCRGTPDRIITNNFVPCNGRFPTLIAIITMFFVGGAMGAFSSVVSTLILTAVIVLGVLMTFAVSALLSRTILKGVPSSFTLELPPYRRPQIGKVIVRSIFDRTLFVLGRDCRRGAGGSSSGDGQRHRRGYESAGPTARASSIPSRCCSG